MGTYDPLLTSSPGSGCPNLGSYTLKDQGQHGVTPPERVLPKVQGTLSAAEFPIEYRPQFVLSHAGKHLSPIQNGDYYLVDRRVIVDRRP